MTDDDDADEEEELTHIELYQQLIQYVICVFQVPGNTLQVKMSWNKQHLCNEIITEVSAID